MPEADAQDPTPEQAPAALVLVDVINTYDFPGAEDLRPWAAKAVPVIADLKKRAKAAGMPVIYTNDHFSHWRDDFRAVVRRALDGPSRALVEPLLPDEDDYFVLKPKHSAFFGTPLDLLLDRLGARTIILTGVAADICILATAVDAKMREYRLIIPSDATAAESDEAYEQALAYARRVLDAETPPAADVNVEALMEREDSHS
ncbi:MAG TPA: isochorismatase family cysteine hydrolase [Rhodothermales bacterium]|nr:isochorismatase family cysteine hydrolase [Rhodothermales bacterium]